MSKRANGEGTIYKQPNGSWRGAVTLGHDEHGKQIRRSYTGKTQSEVKAKLQAALREHHEGTLVQRTPTTVAEFMQEWLRHKERTVRQKTHLEYRQVVKLHITSHIGGVKLMKVTPLTIEQLLSHLSEQGASPQLLKRVYELLRQAFYQAVNWGLLGSNPAQKVKPPRVEARTLTVWSGNDARTFLEAIRTHRLYPMFYLALTTGMRRGELLGLHWEDVDLEGQELLVRYSLVQCGHEVHLNAPKTRTSFRRITLSPDTVSVLREYRKNQAADQKLVFPSTHGTYMLPSNVVKIFGKLIQQAGVPRIRLHDLRHTSASLLIASKVPVKVVSERLGHTDASLTLKVYTHVYEEQRREAALPMTALLGSGQLN